MKNERHRDAKRFESGFSSNSRDRKKSNFKDKSKNFKNKLKVTKNKSKSPVELPNNVQCDPFKSEKNFTKAGGSKKHVARDPRFSDFSGKLNMDMFKRSYNFLNEMRDEEVKEITKAIKINKKFGTSSSKGIESFKKISHLNIKTLEDAKKALDRYKSEKVQLEKGEEIRELKRKLVKEEKEKIATTGKKPYYFPDKKVKLIYKDIQRKKIEESMKSTSINYGPDKKIHKKLESQSKKELSKQRKLNNIPVPRDV